LPLRRIARSASTFSHAASRDLRGVRAEVLDVAPKHVKCAIASEAELR